MKPETITEKEFRSITFNPPLAGMVVETKPPSDAQQLNMPSFNPPLAGMVVETCRSTELGLTNQFTSFNPPLAGMVVETRPV
ncbi:hypothetical protein [Nostoc sp.]|uniref:hypothetical protein n=1 Tax=Nostoc sp. TaxID=1180 RepID=UPI003FA534F1